MLDESIFHGLVASITLHPSLAHYQSPTESQYNYLQTSSLQSRTNCLIVLRNLSISKSVGLYRFLFADAEVSCTLGISWEWLRMEWLCEWQCVCPCMFDQKETWSQFNLVFRDQTWLTCRVCVGFHRIINFGRGFIIPICQGANIMSKYLRVCDDLIQKLLIGQNSIVNIRKFLFITKTFQKFKVSVRQCVQVLTAPVICG